MVTIWHATSMRGMDASSILWGSRGAILFTRTRMRSQSWCPSTFKLLAWREITFGHPQQELAIVTKLAYLHTTCVYGSINWTSLQFVLATHQVNTEVFAKRVKSQSSNLASQESSTHFESKTGNEFEKKFMYNTDKSHKILAEMLYFEYWKFIILWQNSVFITWFITAQVVFITWMSQNNPCYYLQRHWLDSLRA